MGGPKTAAHLGGPSSNTGELTQDRNFHPESAVQPSSECLELFLKVQRTGFSNTVSIVMMSRTVFVIALVGGILALPLLCIAGVTEHDCVCVSVECCAEETTCEPDPCNAIYEKKDRREPDPDGVPAIVPPLSGISASVIVDGPAAASTQDTCCNLPFPDSDLPLRI